MKQESKKCTVCKEVKTVDKFYLNKFGAVRPHCKECHIGGVLNGRRNNKKKCSLDGCGLSHYGHGYCRNHYEQVRKNGQITRTAKEFHGDVSDPRNLRKYGVTEEDFIQMSKDGCQVCGVKVAGRFALDHDHSCCNEVPYCGECTRGFVCQSCNISIARYEGGSIHPTNPVKEDVVRYLTNYATRRTRLNNIKTWHDIIVDPDNKRKEW